VIPAHQCLEVSLLSAGTDAKAQGYKSPRLQSSPPGLVRGASTMYYPTSASDGFVLSP
jgi:hypothetical protein